MQDKLDVMRANLNPDYKASLEAAVEHLHRTGVPQRGKQKGERAPDFGLTAHDGRTIVMSEILASGPVVLSFFRGEWCSFCQAEIEALLAAQPEMADLGASLVMIARAKPSAALLSMVTGRPKTFLLQDPMLGIALQYGLVFLAPEALRLAYVKAGLNLPVLSPTGSWLLPIPADFIIGDDGRIVFSHIDPDYTHRLDPDALVKVLGQLRLERPEAAPLD